MEYYRTDVQGLLFGVVFKVFEWLDLEPISKLIVGLLAKQGMNCETLPRNYKQKIYFCKASIWQKMN